MEYIIINSPLNACITDPGLSASSDLKDGDDLFFISGTFPFLHINEEANHFTDPQTWP